MTTNSTSPPAVDPACTCTDGCPSRSCAFSRSLARRALLDDPGGVIVSVCFVAGCFALGCSSRGRGFRVLLPARSGPEAGREPSALRGFLFFFGGGSGELIATLALSPQIHTFATSLQVPLSRWSVDMWCCVSGVLVLVRERSAGTSLIPLYTLSHAKIRYVPVLYCTDSTAVTRVYCIRVYRVSYRTCTDITEVGSGTRYIPVLVRFIGL